MDQDFFNSEDFKKAVAALHNSFMNDRYKIERILENYHSFIYDKRIMQLDTFAKGGELK